MGRLRKIRVGSLSATQAHNSELLIFGRLSHGSIKNRTSESLDWLIAVPVFASAQCSLGFQKVDMINFMKLELTETPKANQAIPTFCPYKIHDSVG